MFNLSEADLTRKILDCASGPASFNAEMYERGYRVISCDPVYQFSVEEINRRIQETFPQIVEGVKQNYHNYVWQEIPSPEALGKVRMKAMEKFLADFPIGQPQGRYLNYALPSLPFCSAQFDLALCSHLLFTYSSHFSCEFHIAAIREMKKVATQVRIFPLLDISGEVSPFLQPVMNALIAEGYNLQIQKTPYEFQRGGNQVLLIN